MWGNQQNQGHLTFYDGRWREITISFLPADGVGELDAVGINTIRSKPGEGDGGLLIGVSVGDCSLRVLLAATDVVADGSGNAKLADEVAALLGVDQESAECGGAILSSELKLVVRVMLVI